MPVFLSQTTIATVKATIPALETHGVTITQRVYDRIFKDPAIRALFDKPLHDVTRSQPVALANAIVAYAKNIDNLGALAIAGVFLNSGGGCDATGPPLKPVG